MMRDSAAMTGETPPKPAVPERSSQLDRITSKAKPEQ